MKKLNYILSYFHTEVFQSEEKKVQSQQTKYNPSTISMSQAGV